MDLKHAGLMPLFSAARVLALRHGVSEPSTPGRFEAVRATGSEAAHVIDDLIEAHKILLSAILHQQLRDIEAGLKLGNSIDPAQISEHDIQQVRRVVDQMPKVRDLLGIPAYNGGNDIACDLQRARYSRLSLSSNRYGARHG